MFARSSFLAVALLSVFAAATPVPGGDDTSLSQCNTGSQQCCDSVHSSSDPDIGNLLPIGILDKFEGLVGLSCTNIVGNAGCTAQPVCCQDNQFNGLVAVGCSPINL